MCAVRAYIKPKTFNGRSSVSEEFQSDMSIGSYCELSVVVYQVWTRIEAKAPSHFVEF